MDDDPFIVSYSRPKLAGMFAAQLAGVVLCLLGLGVFGENPFPGEPGPFGRFLSWIGVAFFSACGAKLLAVVLRTGEAARFDSKGVRIALEDTISWDQICGAKRWTQRLRSGSLIPTKIHWLVLDVDPSYERDLPFWRVWFQNLNYGFSGGSHSITAIATDRSPDEIVEGFNRLAPDRLKIMHDQGGV